MGSFLEAVLASGHDPGHGGGFFGFGGHSGSAPAPFDALDGPRLAGRDGSHPLALVRPLDLLRPTSDGLDGEIVLDGPVRVGEGISGRLSVVARRIVEGRSVALRLVGVRLAEHKRSIEHRDSEGRVTSRDEWVEVGGDTFEQLPFTEPALPTRLAPGERFETTFLVPAPRLGPPSAHLGSAMIVWALEARWDVAMGADQRVASLVEVRQHPDYLRSGAARLAEGSLFDAWPGGDASIAVSPLPPVAAGSDLDVIVTWPGAGSGRGARLELHADIAGPNPIAGLVLFSAPVDPSAFRSGVRMTLPIPADAPPTVTADGLGVAYRLRALVDRQLMKDLAIERPIAVL